MLLHVQPLLSSSLMFEDTAQVRPNHPLKCENPYVLASLKLQKSDARPDYTPGGFHIYRSAAGAPYAVGASPWTDFGVAKIFEAENFQND
jgi:hypothetical protein